MKDTNGFVLDAQLSIVALKRTTLADSAGRFRFGGLKPGRYQVSARRIGFFAQTKSVLVTDTGASVNFALVPLVYSLPPITKTAVRGGLSGVIGDTSYAGINDVDVRIISTSRRAVSDSLGHFFVDVPAGKWMVKVSKKGFGTQVASVTIPPDSGRQLFVWLKPADRGSISKEEFSLREMAERITWGGMNCAGAKGRSMCSMRPAYLTREDITNSGMTEAVALASKGAILSVDPFCKATIANTRLTRELWLISAAEIEWMEVYANRRASYAVTSDVIRNGVRSASKPPAFSREDCPTVIIWLRK